MAEQATNFPPQTYSSSFFLNALPEESGVSNSLNGRRCAEESDSPTLVDCFLKAMSMTTESCILLLMLLRFDLIFAFECSDGPNSFVVYSTTEEYRKANATFDPRKVGFVSNYVEIEEVARHVNSNEFKSRDSNYIVRLKLNNGVITTVNDSSFANLYCLKHLELQMNDIGFIDTDAFNGLPNLQRLNLSANDIHTLSSGVFNNLTSLTTLDLSNNKIRIIKDDIFNSLISLVYLNLRRNHITNIDLDEWSALTKMETLILSNNALRHLDFSMTFEFTSLTFLNVYGNQLTEFNAHGLKNYAPKLSKIVLGRNPWNCYDLKDIIAVLKMLGVEYAGTNLTRTQISGIDCLEPAPPYVPYVPSDQISEPDNFDIMQAIMKVKSLALGTLLLVILLIVTELFINIGCIEKVYMRINGHDYPHAERRRHRIRLTTRPSS